MYRTVLFLTGALFLAPAGMFLPAHAAARSDVIAITRNNNVFLVNGQGGAPRTVTTQGTPYTAAHPVQYPWYQWSPDGKYLLLVRWSLRSQTWDILLLDAGGALLRTLASVGGPNDFYPAWAVDSDSIAYIARTAQNHQRWVQTVDTVDLAGRTSFLFSYVTQEGCGGGTGDVAQATYWNETGFGETVPAMQWSVTHHLAVHSMGCGAGLQIVDTATGVHRTLDRAGQSWLDPALAPDGRLAATRFSAANCGPPNCGRQVVLLNPATGAVRRVVARGELPVWSPDGRLLYFVQRTYLRTLHMSDQNSNNAGSTVYRSAVMSAWRNGSHVQQRLSQDAYGFGSITFLPGGQILVFSRVANAYALYRYLHNGGTHTLAGNQAHAPVTTIEQLGPSGRVSTIATRAGRPQPQP